MTGANRAENPAVRVQKYLSRAGVATRRQAERMIDAGRVAVNGQVVQEQGVRVVPGKDVVLLDDVVVEPATTRWIVFHKPSGTLSTRTDPHGGRTVYDVLPGWAKGLRYVGRLDRDTTGLLLMTNDGDVASRLTHPRCRVEREYLVVVRGALTARSLRALKDGVELEDGVARPKRVRRVGSGDGRTTVSLVLTEGRKREVRRMLKAVGYPVIALQR
ncbi:MAG: rRNA pseudouridine synthase, partial [Gemmatimonadetes bacterium]|nr:rRNA pseudouridine synthase [Gemmatimonadota bacterium]